MTFSTNATNHGNLKDTILSHRSVELHEVQRARARSILSLAKAYF